MWARRAQWPVSTRTVFHREWETAAASPLLIVAFPPRGELCVCWAAQGHRPGRKPALRPPVLGQQGGDCVRGLLCCGFGGRCTVRAFLHDSWIFEIFGNSAVCTCVCVASWFSKTVLVSSGELELPLRQARQLAEANVVGSWRLLSWSGTCLTAASDCLAPFMTTTFSPPIEVARLSLRRGVTSQSNWASWSYYSSQAIDHHGGLAVMNWVRAFCVVRNGLDMELSSIRPRR